VWIQTVRRIGLARKLSARILASSVIRAVRTPSVALNNIDLSASVLMDGAAIRTSSASNLSAKWMKTVHQTALVSPANV